MSSTKLQVHNIMPPEEHRATAISNTQRKFDKVWMYGSRNMLANTYIQTDRQIHSSQNSASLQEGEEGGVIIISAHRNEVQNYNAMCLAKHLLPSPLHNHYHSRHLTQSANFKVPRNEVCSSTE